MRTILRSLFTLLLLTGLTAFGAQAALAGDAEPEPLRVVIEPVGNQLLFEQDELSVEAGQQVTIVFKNTATSPAMEHNVIVLNDNSDATINRVGQAALSAAANEYIPEDDAVLAATPLAKPGETVEVTFTAPSEPGQYSYICTFPGHYAMMRGVMTVK
jgi:azurin